MKKQLGKQYTAIVIIIAAIVIVQCTNTKPATTTKPDAATTMVKADPFHPQQTDVPLAQVHWPSATADELVLGYKLYSTKCTDCHEMKNLVEFSVGDWPGIMQQMSRKAKLDSTQYNQVWHYIVSRREALVAEKK